jgi:hypothetical protein
MKFSVRIASHERPRAYADLGTFQIRATPPASVTSSTREHGSEHPDTRQQISEWSKAKRPRRKRNGLQKNKIKPKRKQIMIGRRLGIARGRERKQRRRSLPKRRSKPTSLEEAEVYDSPVTVVDNGQCQLEAEIAEKEKLLYQPWVVRRKDGVT